MTISEPVFVRVYISKDEIFSRDVFCYELNPMESSKCGSDEWIERHLDEFNAADYRNVLEIKEENFQALFTCKVKGSYDYCDEWNEHLEIVGKVFVEPIPDNYLKFMSGDV